jgi:hypothetical protein
MATAIKSQAELGFSKTISGGTSRRHLWFLCSKQNLHCNISEKL